MDLIRRTTGETAGGAGLNLGWVGSCWFCASDVEGRQHALLSKMCSQDGGVTVADVQLMAADSTLMKTPL